MSHSMSAGAVLYAVVVAVFSTNLCAQADSAVPIQVALKSAQKDHKGRIGLELRMGARVFGTIVERGATFVVLEQEDPHRRIRVEHAVIAGLVDPMTGAVIAVDAQPPKSKPFKMSRGTKIFMSAWLVLSFLGWLANPY